MSNIKFLSKKDSPIKVELIDWTKKPINAIFQGIDIMNSEELDSKKEAVLDLQNTGLRGALEHPHFEVRINNVTRAFTHQLVRYRHMSFSQESMRFVEKGNLKVRVGPSVDIENESTLAIYKAAVKETHDRYKILLNDGVDQQDARGILPINTMTNIIFSCNFRSLVNMAETRMCKQAAEDEWTEMIFKLKNEINNKVRDGDVLNEFLQAICYRTKKCEFESMLDRPCKLQERWKDYNG